jgi:4-alpha-glucanotransferase
LLLGPAVFACTGKQNTHHAFLLCVQVYANAKGIKIIGDMPIYVGGQSADVWANR